MGCTCDLSYRNPKTINSSWLLDEHSNPILTIFEFEVDMEGLSTLMYEELDRQLFSIKLRSPANLINDNEGHLECTDEIDYPDELTYVAGQVLHVVGQVRKIDFDDLMNIFSNPNFKFRLIHKEDA